MTVRPICGRRIEGRRAAPAARAATALAAASSLALLAPGTAAVAAVPGPANGVGSLPAATILSRAASALASRPSVEISGSVALGPAKIGFTVRSAARGRDAAGTITIATGRTVTGPVRFVEVGTTAFLEAPAAFWRQAFASTKSTASGAGAGAAVAALAGKWISITGTEARSFTGGLGGLTDPGQFARSILSPGAKLKKGPTTTVSGTRVVPITTGPGAVVDVALDGPPLPVEVHGAVSLGALSVSVEAAISYPAALAIVAPAGAVPLSSVTG